MGSPSSHFQGPSNPCIVPIKKALSIHPYAYNNSRTAEWFVMKFDIWEFCKKLLRNFNFGLNQLTITGTLHEKLHTFLQSDVTTLDSASVLPDEHNAPHPCKYH
jgi:hypothetical protein